MESISCLLVSVGSRNFATAKLPASIGHVFYDALNGVLRDGKFDSFTASQFYRVTVLPRRCANRFTKKVVVLEFHQASTSRGVKKLRGSRPSRKTRAFKRLRVSHLRRLISPLSNGHWPCSAPNMLSRLQPERILSLNMDQVQGRMSVKSLLETPE
jgi:hypothetical protein